MKKQVILCDICQKEIRNEVAGKMSIGKNSLQIAWDIGELKTAQTYILSREIKMPEKMKIDLEDLCDDCILKLRTPIFSIIINENPEYNKFKTFGGI